MDPPRIKLKGGQESTITINRLLKSKQEFSRLKKE